MLLVIPYPPSVNSIWRQYRGRTILSKEYRDYKTMVARLLGVNPVPTKARIRICIYAYMPDRRRRDLDNLTKVTIDILTHAGVWMDDEQIDDLRIIRAGIDKPGRLEIEIEEIES
jgi:crossover junction endodeoxyribonuclease RusA